MIKEGQQLSYAPKHTAQAYELAKKIPDFRV